MKILLIQRKNDPFAGKWALPGGFVDVDEDIDKAAARELKEETGIEDLDLSQFRTYGKPGRDPRGHTISVVYICKIERQPFVQAGDDAAEAKWFEVENLPQLAFDHALIISNILEGL